MNRRTIAILAGVAALGTASLALAFGADQEGSSEPTLGAPTAVSDPKSGPRENPDAGLTDEQRHAKYTSLSAAFWTRYEVWVVEFNAADIDLRTLEQAEVESSWLPPEPTLAEAVSKAETIVEVEAIEIAFGAHSSAAIFEVRSTLKGTANGRIRVEKNGGVYPRDDWSFEGAILGSAPNAPLLLPGDRAVLFLAKDVNLDVIVIQPGSGFYRVESGVIVPLEMNPFGGEVTGMTVAEFALAVRGAGTR